MELELDGVLYTSLLGENDFPYFLLKQTSEDVEHKFDFEVYEVDSWLGDGSNTPSEIDLYLKGHIKWDGCSHITFGTLEYPGYLHLCGKKAWELHCEMMAELYSIAEKVIIQYNKEAAN